MEERPVLFILFFFLLVKWLKGMNKICFWDSEIMELLFGHNFRIQELIKIYNKFKEYTINKLSNN